MIRRVQRAVFIEVDVPAVFGLLQAVHGGLELERLAQSVRERIGEYLQSFVERKLRRAVLRHFASFLPLARAKDLAFDQGAVFCLKLRELWEGLLHR